MGDILRSLSPRFYLSLFCALILLGIVFNFAALLTLAGTAVLSTLVILFIFVPLVFLLLGIFYKFFGVFRRTPAARFQTGIKITRPDGGEQPYWLRGAKTPNAGTLERFKEQDRAADDDTELTIGIVLAGGGAKGVYQAGSLQALWEFLASQDALQYVRAVAGTSIGSWNAMFWLTRQIANGGLREWWASAAPHKMVGLTFYVPVLRNYILHNQPWQEQFSTIFRAGGNALVDGGPPFFYFTRTNVSRARLEFTTNHAPGDRYWGLTRQDHNQPGRYRQLDPIVDEGKGYYRASGFEDLRLAVFTSMDIPPAFRRLNAPPTEEKCEDGGVIDNLPIRFVTRFEVAI